MPTCSPGRSGESPRILSEAHPAGTAEPDSRPQLPAGRRRLGGSDGSRLITAEEGRLWWKNLRPLLHSSISDIADEVAFAVRAALTDAELFISYNMPEKALGPLLRCCPRRPGSAHQPALASLHTRAGRFAEAAVCCPHAWKAFITTPDIPRKQPVTANWRPSMKTARLKPR